MASCRAFMASDSVLRLTSAVADGYHWFAFS
jgi:hypothetical protein